MIDLMPLGVQPLCEYPQRWANQMKCGRCSDSSHLCELVRVLPYSCGGRLLSFIGPSCPQRQGGPVRRMFVEARPSLETTSRLAWVMLRLERAVFSSVLGVDSFY